MPKRFHQVSDVLYRSGQPNAKEFHALESIGISSVLNLRAKIDDKRRLKKTSLKAKRIKMRAKRILEEDVLEAIRFIQNSEGPVLVHCYHGSDRTGCIVAVYRIIEQDWTKAQALDELRNKLFSYNEGLFPEIAEFIEELNVEEFKSNL